MPWSDNSGNGGRGPHRGPWGQPPRDNGGGRDNGRGQPPDLEELLQASRQRLKRAFPRGGGAGGRDGGPGLPVNSRTLAIGAAIVLGLWGISGFYQVDADELGVVTTFGKYSTVSGPGLHWHIPAPFQNARMEKVTEIRETAVPEGGRGDVREGSMLTGDKNIVDVAFIVQWRIKAEAMAANGEMPGVAQYMFNIDDPVQLVRAVAEAAIREVVGRNELDFVQTEGRGVVQEQTRELIQAALDLYESGIEVTGVNLEKTEPPTAEVNAAFLDVEAAKQDREQYVNTARAYANQVIPEARGQAQRIIEDANAYAARVTAEARGQAARFENILTEYEKAPQVTRERMYLETIEGVVGDMNKVIMEDEGSGVVPYLPLTELQKRRSE